MNQDLISRGTTASAILARTALVVAGVLEAMASGPALAQAGSGGSGAATPPSVDLSSKQLQLIKLAKATTRKFAIKKSTVGSIDYNQNTEVQVFTPYQGRILAVFPKLNERVKAGQPLFTIDSSDLMQAEATLVQTAGVLELTTRSLARARKLVPAGGGAQKDLDQAVSDQQTAEGNLKAARDTLHIFGKDEAEIDQIVSERHLDGTLVVKSPLNGVVVASAGVPGLFVQPGNAPAPLTVADLSTKWMVANFVEADSAALKSGQDVSAQVLAIPNLTFHSRVSAVYENIDPSTRRFAIRAEISDPNNILRPGMFANMSIVTGEAVEAVALPVDGVVREGDGTMTAWVTENGSHFTQRVVKVGMQQDGLDQIIDGIRAGETVVTEGAVFLNNILEAGPSD